MVCREAKSWVGYKKLMDYGNMRVLGVVMLWTERRVCAVLWGVKGRAYKECTVAAAVQRALASVRKDQWWPTTVQDNVRR